MPLAFAPKYSAASSESLFIGPTVHGYLLTTKTRHIRDDDYDEYKVDESALTAALVSFMGRARPSE